MAASGSAVLFLTGFVQNFGGGEVIVVVIIALVVLGPERLPQLARDAGKMIHKFKSMTSGLQTQVRDVMDDPAMKPIRELGEFAARPRQKLSEYALEAEAEERSRHEEASIDSAQESPAPLPGGTAPVPAPDPIPVTEDAVTEDAVESVAGEAPADTERESA